VLKLKYIYFVNIDVAMNGIQLHHILYFFIDEFIIYMIIQYKKSLNVLFCFKLENRSDFKINNLTYLLQSYIKSRL